MRMRQVISRWPLPALTVSTALFKRSLKEMSVKSSPRIHSFPSKTKEKVLGNEKKQKGKQ